MRVMAIGFYGNSPTHLRALEASGWCDTFYLQPNKLVAGIPGTISEFKKLSIDFSKYDAALIFSDALTPVQQYFCEQCIENNITIYANQHGFNKSILQIAGTTPNIYSKYWNVMGNYFLDRFKEVQGEDALSQRWICVGSLMHDYLFKNYKWNPNGNNGKALIIHEPDLWICEGDKHPHNSEQITQHAILRMNQYGIEVDMKPHPNWKNFVGNSGRVLQKPIGANLVDIRVEDVVNYALVVGSRSTLLLDAVAMGVPTLAIESFSDWQDDKYPPVEEGLVPTFSQNAFVEGLQNCFNREPRYDSKFRDYFLGSLGSVSENYINFIKNDLDNPLNLLKRSTYTNWKIELKEYQATQKKFLSIMRRVFIFFRGCLSFTKIRLLVKSKNIT